MLSTFVLVLDLSSKLHQWSRRRVGMTEFKREGEEYWNNRSWSSKPDAVVVSRISDTVLRGEALK